MILGDGSALPVYDICVGVAERKSEEETFVLVAAVSRTPFLLLRVSESEPEGLDGRGKRYGVGRRPASISSVGLDGPE